MLNQNKNKTNSQIKIIKIKKWLQNLIQTCLFKTKKLSNTKMLNEENENQIQSEDFELRKM